MTFTGQPETGTLPLFCYPGFPFRQVAGCAPSPMPSPLDRPGAKFFLRGSTALWQGLKWLDLPPGRVILFPSYHCGIELEVLRQAGLRPVFYPVGRDLQIDLNNLRQTAPPDTQALYIIHYFGFPHPLQSLRELCTEQGWALIEDCAHALFSQSEGQSAGLTGDISIFSLHKFLPLPCGGALIPGSKALSRSSRPPRRPPFRYVARQTVDLAGRDVVQLAFMNTRLGLRFRKVISRALQTGFPEGRERVSATGEAGSPAFLKEWRNAGMPALSGKLLPRISRREVTDSRRRNFARLLEITDPCRRLRPLIDRLNSGACPLYFPVVVPDEAHRFLRFCHSRGVQAQFLWKPIHPAFRAGDFPQSGWLRSHAVMLPVHQGLSGQDLERLRRLIGCWEADVP